MFDFSDIRKIHNGLNLGVLGVGESCGAMLGLDRGCQSKSIELISDENSQTKMSEKSYNGHV